MPSWNEILVEIKTSPRIDALDYIRRKYLKRLADLRNRNVICYYSGWLQSPPNARCSIVDDDKNGFMTTIHNLDRSKGLDLILHTPGGDMAATESIIHYLQGMFGSNIEAFIPQLAMSGGTMMACATRKVHMGKQSNIGPIDPQLNGIPAHGVIKEFDEAIKETTKNPQSTPLWQVIISKYHPTFIGECKNAIKLADEMVKKVLENVMFEGDPNAKKRAQKLVKFLNEHDNSKTHARHIHVDEAKNAGMEISDLEDDQNLQDAVLTVHHCYMHTFAATGALKIIENQEGIALIGFPPQNQT